MGVTRALAALMGCAGILITLGGCNNDPTEPSQQQLAPPSGIQRVTDEEFAALAARVTALEAILVRAGDDTVKIVVRGESVAEFINTGSGSVGARSVNLRNRVQVFGVPAGQFEGPSFIVLTGNSHLHNTEATHESALNPTFNETSLTVPWATFGGSGAVVRRDQIRVGSSNSAGSGKRVLFVPN